jgi:4-amino-4-deoxy-L-arabinose transferase-like glycosyltransferase
LRGVHRRLSQIPEALILFGAIFLFFNLSGSRRPYYLLPILPFVAILVANMLREFEVGTLGRVTQGIVRFIGFVLGLAPIALFGILLLFPHVIPAHADTLWPMSIFLALLGVTTIVSVMKKYVWGMVGPVTALWLIYMIVVTPWITEGPNLKTQVAEVIALDKPCGFLKLDDAKVIFYLDKPYQVFSQKAHALIWAIRADGVLITSSDFSDRHWECAVKSHNWQAVIPRKVPPLNNSSNFK